LGRGDAMRAGEELSWRVRQATGIAKAPYVADFTKLLLESGENVVLYGWHREVYSIWMERLKEFGPAMFTGTESSRQKEAAKQRFLSGDTKLLVMSLRAGAGLDGLQGRCRVLVFGELDWSPGVHEQCIGRAYRDGQNHNVLAYFLITNEGSDPIVADTLGIKKMQIDGIRDPHGALIKKLDLRGENVRRLAQRYLKKRSAVPVDSPVST